MFSFLISLFRFIDVVREITIQTNIHPLWIMSTTSQPQETPKYRTFREHYDRLVNSISDPLPLATRLFARSIIDCTLLQRVNISALPPFQNTNTLLTAILGKIQTDPSAFDVFLSALSEDPSMWPLVESMQSKCFVLVCDDLSYPMTKCPHEFPNVNETKPLWPISH